MAPADENVWEMNGGTQRYVEAITRTGKKQRPTRFCRVLEEKKINKQSATRNMTLCVICEDRPPFFLVDCFKSHHSNI